MVDLVETAGRNGKRPIDKMFAALPVQCSHTGG